MLERTFCHITGVGGQTERSLWQQGCLKWQDYLGSPGDYRIGSTDRRLFDKFVLRSQQLLAEEEHTFFATTLGTKEAWRAWPNFRRSTVYLDIETNGGQSGDSITTIGLYDGAEFTCLVNGDDLAHNIRGRMGEMTVDMGGDWLPGFSTRADVNFSMGECRLTIPENVRISPNSSASMFLGESHTAALHDEGPSDPDAPTLEIHATAKMGEFRITRN